MAKMWPPSPTDDGSEPLIQRKKKGSFGELGPVQRRKKGDSDTVSSTGSGDNSRFDTQSSFETPFDQVAKEFPNERPTVDLSWEGPSAKQQKMSDRRGLRVFAYGLLVFGVLDILLGVFKPMGDHTISLAFYIIGAETFVFAVALIDFPVKPRKTVMIALAVMFGVFIVSQMGMVAFLGREDTLLYLVVGAHVPLEWYAFSYARKVYRFENELHDVWEPS